MSRNVEKEMESARDLGKGTMGIWVVFDTKEQVSEAKKWMKGKQRVKNLEPLTTEDAEVRRKKRFQEISDHYSIGREARR